MKAAVCRAFGRPLTIEDVDIAEPGAGEVKVRLTACAICHSDVILVDGGWGGDLPAVYGHEAAGIVASIGPGVTGLKPGDPVVVTLIRSCGSCHYCKQSIETQCDGVFPLDQQSPLSDSSGQVVSQGLNSGAFAEQVVVEQSQVCVIPEDIPLEIGLTLHMKTPSGQPLPVTVVAMDEATVTLDANHALAGKTLTFDFEVVSIN